MAGQGQGRGQGTPGSRGVLPTYEVAGDIWMSTAMPALFDGVKNKKLTLVPYIYQSIAVSPSIAPLVRPIADKLSSIKGLPLRTHIVISRVLTNQDPPTPPDPLLIDTEVTAITEGPLPESLFQVPEGYTEIKFK